MQPRIFHRKLRDLLRRARWSDMVFLSGDMNALVGQLSLNVAHLGLFCPSSCLSENRLCSAHQLFLVGANFRHFSRWYAFSSQRRTQVAHTAISYRWRICLQDLWPHGIIALNSDHAFIYRSCPCGLVCAQNTLCSIGWVFWSVSPVNFSKHAGWKVRVLAILWSR